MFSLLDLSALLPDHVSEAYRAQANRVDRCCTGLPNAVIDQLWGEFSALAEIESNEHFLWGLHLGAQLTLQLLAPPPLSKNPPL